MFVRALLLSLLFLLLSGLAGFAQTTYMGNTTDGPRFRRPNGGNPPISLAAMSGTMGGDVAYHTYSFTPTETAQYRIVCTTAPTWDNFLLVYEGTFNPMSALTNCRAANDDYGNTTRAGIDALPMTAGQVYTIVVTAFSNAGQGAFETVITPLPPTTATTGRPVFQRPVPNGSSPPTTLSGAASAVPYNMLELTPPETGTYRFVSTSATPGFNNFTVLYRNSFNPASPLTNVLIANENLAGETTSGFEVELTAGTPYIFVTTGSTMDDYGAYTVGVERVQGVTVSGTTTGMPTYHRPNEGAPPTTLSTQGTEVPYAVYYLSVTAAANVNLTVTSQTAGYDVFTTLHGGDFDAERPLAYILFANDDKGGTNMSGFDSVPMLPGTDYVLVVSGFNNTDFGSFTLTASGTQPVTVSTGRTVSGTVTQQDCPNKAFEATLLFHPLDNSGDLNRLVNVAANGSFSVRDLFPKNYQVKVKTVRTLAKVVSADLTEGNVSGLNVGALLGGDANDDNSVDVLDLDRLIQAFDAVMGEPRYFSGTDFNCDESVDVLDLDIFIRRFDQQGEDF
jgi:hypothetical protein